MANRNTFTPKTMSPSVVMVAGSFAPNGAAAISDASNIGHGWSVARTSAGLFTITFTDKYPQLISFVCTLQEATAGDQILIAGAYTPASRTITITNWDISGLAATDIAANANNRINFVAVFLNSDARPVRGS